MKPKSPLKKGSKRRRRSAYSSGRKEMIGVEKSPVKRKTRKVGDGSPAFDRPSFRASLGSALKYTPFKSNFRWRSY